MEITIQGTNVLIEGNPFIGFAVNNLVNRFQATTDKDNTWSYQLKVYMVEANKFNIINLDRLEGQDNVIYVDMTRDMLPFGGRYSMQFIAYKDDLVDQTELFDIWVNHSIDPECAYDPVPSEFYQIQENIMQIYEDIKNLYEQIGSGGILDVDLINGGNAYGTAGEGSDISGITGGNANGIIEV